MPVNPASRSFRALLERFVHRRPRNLKRGDESKEQRASNREHEGERGDRRVDFDLAEMRQTLRASGAEKIDAPSCQQQTGRAAEEREQQTLAEKLPNDQSAACAQRSSDRDLAPARCGSRQE